MTVSSGGRGSTPIDGDENGPTVPTALEARALSPSQIRLQCAASTEDVDIDYYEAWTNNTLAKKPYNVIC